MRMAPESTAKLTVERSRFIALLFPAKSETDVKAMLKKRRKAVKRANHHCWAARFEDDAGRVVELARDDGEVGRPGWKILEELKRRELFGALIVSRVFGGVKLGPAGVGRAFRRVARDAIDAAIGGNNE